MSDLSCNQPVADEGHCLQVPSRQEETVVLDTQTNSLCGGPSTYGVCSVCGKSQLRGSYLTDAERDTEMSSGEYCQMVGQCGVAIISNLINWEYDYSDGCIPLVGCN